VEAGGLVVPQARKLVALLPCAGGHLSLTVSIRVEKTMPDTINVKVEVSERCERKDCRSIGDTVFIVTGEYGEDGLVTYCVKHSDEIGHAGDNYTPVATIPPSI